MTDRTLVRHTRANRQAVRIAGIVVIVLLMTAGIVVLGLGVGSDRAELIISEVVTSNANLAPASSGNHYDLIELHNPTNEAVELAEYRLTLGGREPWEFPDRELEAGGYLLVHASGRNIRSATGELHTDFRLSRTGVTLELAGPAGSDRITVPALPRNASYGRHPGSANRFCFYAFPSPGTPNGDECFADETLGAPRFSQPSGFYDSPIVVELLPHDEGEEIWYTLDGSYPDPEENPSSTFNYDGPIEIIDRTGEPNTISAIDATVPSDIVEWTHPVWVVPHPPVLGYQVPKATTLRARSPGSQDSTATYFVDLHHELPTLSLVIEPRYLFDHDDGIYVPGRVFEEFLRSADFGPHRFRSPTNYRRVGREWERPFQDELHNAASLTWCVRAGCEDPVPVGVRIHGSATRSQAQKSLRLYTRADYGTDGFALPLFDRDLARPHRRIILRSSGNDWRGDRESAWTETMLLDAYLQSMLSGLRVDVQDHRQAVLYINGEYWGIHNVRERYDSHYFAAIFDVDPDVIELAAGGPPDPVVELLDRFETSSVSVEEFIDELDAIINIESFHDFVFAQLFVANTDWGANNVRYWRSTEVIDQSDLDGRWNWALIDLDLMGGGGQWNIEHNLLPSRAFNGGDREARAGYPHLFWATMLDEDLRRRFRERAGQLLSVELSPDRTVPALREMAARIENEIPSHDRRWTFDFGQRSWVEEIESLATFMRERPAQIGRAIEEYLDGLENHQLDG